MMDWLLQTAGNQTWQIAVVGLFTAAAVATFGKRRPHLARVLWMIVMIKALTPPLWPSPSSVFSWVQSVSQPVKVERSFNSSGLSLKDADTSTGIFPATAARARAPQKLAGPEERRLPWRQALVVIWLAGAASIIAVPAVSYRRCLSAVFRSKVPAEDDVFEEFRQLAAELGLRNSPRLLVSALPDSPFACGVRHPTVVLPLFFTNLPPNELRAILAHELIHLRRRDPALAVLQAIAVAIWWWHPVVWWASRNASRECERCCDAELLSSLPIQPADYAQCLINVLRGRVATAQRLVPLTIALASPTRRRMEHLLTSERFAARTPRRHLLAAGLIALVVLPGGSFTASEALQEDSPAARPPISAQDDEPGNENQPMVQPPELLYLAWQSKDEGDANSNQPHLWRPDGTLVDDEVAADARKLISKFAHRRQEGELCPLLLVFKADRSMQDYSVGPRVEMPNLGQRSSGGTWWYVTDGGLAVSSATFRADEAKRWPQTAALEIRYPIENVQVIKTITEIPDEPVKIAEGITWFLNPDYAMKFDPEARRMDRVFGRTAAILQMPTYVHPLDSPVDYAMQIRVAGEEDFVDEEGSTIREIDGIRYTVQFSNALDNDKIQRVQILRRRYAHARIANVQLRVDLLPE